MNDIPVIVLAGGLATRLGQVAQETPKVLLKVRGKTFLDLKIKQLIDGGATSIFLLVGHLGEKVFDHIQHSEYSIPIVLISDGMHLKGTAGSLISALPAMGFERFILTYGDNLLSLPLNKLWKFGEIEPRNILVVTDKLGPSDNYNAAIENGEVYQYSKKDVGRNTHVDYGYVLLNSKEIMEFEESSPRDLSEIFNQLALQRKLAAYSISLPYEEIGTPASLELANDSELSEEFESDLK